MTRPLAGLLFLAALGTAQEPLTFVARDAKASLLQAGGAPVVIPFTADPIPAGGDVFHIIASLPGTEAVLVTPAKNEISAATAESQGYGFTVFKAVPNSAFLTGPAAIPGFHTFIDLPPGAAPGEYQVHVRPGTISAPATVRAFYNSSSLVRVALAPGESAVRAGDDLAFSAMVFDDQAPLAGAKAMLRIASKDTPGAPPEPDLELPDSGDIDPTAGDGHYIGVWTATRPGRYSAAVKVTGTSANGVPFTRIATADFTVLPPLARLESLADSAIDDNGDGTPDRVAVNARLTVSTPGNYQLLFNLRTPDKFLTSRTSAKLDSGAVSLQATLPFSDLATLNANGPFAISDLFVIYLDDPELPAAAERPAAGQTGAYPLPSVAGAKPLSLSTASLAFGDVETGSEKALDLVLTNAAPYPFTEAVLRLSNELFSVRAPGPTVTVPASGTLTLSVRFRPTATGPQSGTLSIAGLTVNLSANGIVPTATPPSPVPVLSAITPETATAGSPALTLTVSGTNFTRTSVVRWNGSPRTTTFQSATTLTAAILASDLASPATVQVTVFTPSPGGGTSAVRNFTVSSPNATPAAIIDVSPASLAFGDVAAGQSKDLPLTVRNTGNAGLTISAASTSAAAFTIPGLSLPLAVAPGGSATISIRFSPSAAGSVAAALSLTSNAPARDTVSVSLSGNGTAPSTTPRTVTLAVDDGSFETAIGQPAGVPNIVFVNRLTPSSYPAKLTRIQVYFGTAPDELPAGHPVTLLVAQNPGGSANISGLSFQRFEASVGTRGGFNSLTLAAPITITSGDFVIGFATRNPAGIYPMAADATPPLRQRSYISTDGVSFTLADTLSRDLASNFAIRAVVELP